MAGDRKPSIAPASQRARAERHSTTDAVLAPRECSSAVVLASREAIGSRLRLTREALGFGITAFASKCGLSRTRLQNFEAGRNLIKPEQAAKLFDAFAGDGLDFNWLYSGDMSGISPKIASAIMARTEQMAQSKAGVVNE
jgi:DNA-binding transcriptional regulator YiaG